MVPAYAGPSRTPPQGKRKNAQPKTRPSSSSPRLPREAEKRMEWGCRNLGVVSFGKWRYVACQAVFPFSFGRLLTTFFAKFYKFSLLLHFMHVLYSRFRVCTVRVCLFRGLRREPLATQTQQLINVHFTLFLSTFAVWMKKRFPSQKKLL